MLNDGKYSSPMDPISVSGTRICSNFFGLGADYCCSFSEVTCENIKRCICWFWKIYIHVYVFIYVYVYMNKYIYIYIYIYCCLYNINPRKSKSTIVWSCPFKTTCCSFRVFKQQTTLGFVGARWEKRGGSLLTQSQNILRWSPLPGCQWQVKGLGWDPLPKMKASWWWWLHPE